MSKAILNKKAPVKVFF